MNKFEKISLSPSAASRWTVCKGSPGFIVAHAAELTEESSDWADEGTQAHTVASNLLLGQPVAEDTPTDMLAYAGEYAKFVKDKVGTGMLLVEQKVPLFYQKDRNGIVDAAVISDEYIYIADFKYGVGVSVEAKGNKQLAIYALSLLQHLEDSGLYDFSLDHLITLAIYQPRARDKRTTRLWSLTLRELVEFCTDILTAAKDILANPDQQTFHASDDTCRFCPAAAICTHRTGTLLAALPPEVAEPIKQVLVLPELGTLTPDQLGRVVALGGAVKKFIDDAREHAFTMALGGLSVPGCKLVQGRTSRKWRDEEEAKRLLLQKFNSDECMPRELVSVAQAEKLLKAVSPGTRYMNLFKANIEVAEGKPTLVSDDDPRPALDLNAVKELPNLDEQALLD